MKDHEIDEAIKSYVRTHLSPTQDEIDYVNDKYKEIDNFLAGECFWAGSFARYTAIRPIHDLDVIWITEDEEIWDDPETYMQQLAKDVAEQYENFSTVKPKVEVQTHSITLSFDDIDGGFSIDIVPATPTRRKNDYGDPIFKVPEIIKYDHSRRASYYSKRSTEEVKWIYTDPLGYIAHSVQLDKDTDGNYRKTAKFIKAWRHALKVTYGDEMKLKAFHLEQICVQEFVKNPNMTVYEAVRWCFSQMANYIRNAPLIEDAAYKAMGETKYIDNYLKDDKITQTRKALIVTAIMEANALLPKFLWADPSDVIEELLTTTPKPARPASTTLSTPPAPWAY
ncbi:MAG: hypothetical protein JWM52_619 [Candidatus Saccharibacteria bacterium]|nr:hypothetical protein [Candidatus Saccharibacteria bacterium]